MRRRTDGRVPDQVAAAPGERPAMPLRHRRQHRRGQRRHRGHQDERQPAVRGRPAGQPGAERPAGEHGGGTTSSASASSPAADRRGGAAAGPQQRELLTPAFDGQPRRRARSGRAGSPAGRPARRPAAPATARMLVREPGQDASRPVVEQRSRRCVAPGGRDRRGQRRHVRRRQAVLVDPVAPRAATAPVLLGGEPDAGVVGEQRRPGRGASAAGSGSARLGERHAVPDRRRGIDRLEEADHRHRHRAPSSRASSKARADPQAEQLGGRSRDGRLDVPAGSSAPALDRPDRPAVRRSASAPTGWACRLPRTGAAGAAGAAPGRTDRAAYHWSPHRLAAAARAAARRWRRACRAAAMPASLGSSWTARSAVCAKVRSRAVYRQPAMSCAQARVGELVGHAGARRRPAARPPGRARRAAPRSKRGGRATRRRSTAHWSAPMPQLGGDQPLPHGGRPPARVSTSARHEQGAAVPAATAQPGRRPAAAPAPAGAAAGVRITSGAIVAATQMPTATSRRARRRRPGRPARPRGSGPAAAGRRRGCAARRAR